jgi:hypothetical protein
LWRGPAVYALLALAAGLAAFLWALLRHRLLLYGDATAHLGIARRMVDSATPGLSQWGAPWLPLPHLLDAPLVIFTPLWRTGIAGSVPALLALALGTWFLHRIVRRAWGAGAAAWAALFYGLNPSLLYLAAVPMTESVYLAAFLGLVDQCSEFAVQPRRGLAWRAGAWGLAATLCRYDGWFVLPFALLALWLAAARSRGMRPGAAAWRFCLLAGAGPVFWFGYNWYYLKDPLAFLRGPNSAQQIQAGQLYPGDHALATAALYYLKTVVLTVGVPLAVMALLGLWVWWRRRAPGAAAWLLLLPLPWYLWAMWSGNVPIFVPQYWPHGYYNLRYGVQLLPAVAAWSGLAVAAVVAGVRRVTLPHARAGITFGLALLCGGAYLAMLGGDGPVAYAEAVHNAPDRLAMEHALAAALAPSRPGQRILMYYGTYPGALADDGIPVHDVIQESNYRLWAAALAAPHAYAAWVVVESPGPVAEHINRADLDRFYHRVERLRVPHQPAISVYRLNTAPNPPATLAPAWGDRGPQAGASVSGTRGAAALGPAPIQ